MDQYINQTQTLYNSGARRFLFLTVPPIELSPSVQAGGPDNVKAEGAAVKQYNDALKSRVAKFAATNPLAKTYVVDTTVPFMKAIDNPKAYGADNATCFDESGTKCLWWNDVSLIVDVTSVTFIRRIAEADCISTILDLLYTSSLLKQFQWRCTSDEMSLEGDDVKRFPFNKAFNNYIPLKIASSRFRSSDCLQNFIVALVYTSLRVIRRLLVYNDDEVSEPPTHLTVMACMSTHMLYPKSVYCE